jgi:hypothetical protein
MSDDGQQRGGGTSATAVCQHIDPNVSVPGYPEGLIGESRRWLQAL